MREIRTLRSFGGRRLRASGASSYQLATAVAHRLRPGPDAATLGSVEAQRAAHQAQLRDWLRPGDGSRGLRLTKVHDLLTRQGVEVPSSSLHRDVVQHCGFQDARRLPG